MFINLPSSQLPTSTSTHPSLLVVNNLTDAKWRWLEIELKRFSPPTVTPASHFILRCYKLDDFLVPTRRKLWCKSRENKRKRAFMFMSDEGDESSCDVTKRKNIQNKNNAKQEWENAEQRKQKIRKWKICALVAFTSKTLFHALRTQDRKMLVLMRKKKEI